MAGLNPTSAAEVHASVGSVLRSFVNVKESVGHLHESLAPLNLQAAPYNMSPEDETLIKSAVNGLDADLDGVDMTWINRLVGMW